MILSLFLLAAGLARLIVSGDCLVRGAVQGSGESGCLAGYTHSPAKRWVGIAMPIAYVLYVATLI